MAKRDAKRYVQQIIISGYRHNVFFWDKEKIVNFLKHKDEPLFLGDIDAATYADVIAPNKQRGMKNSCICFTTLICWISYEIGADIESCLTLSDYYFNEIENQNDKQKLYKLMMEMLENYRDLIHEEEHPGYSKPVRNIIRYIHQNIYGHCQVAELAALVKLNPKYMSTIFKKEIGMKPSCYIRQIKIKQVAKLLTQKNSSVTQIAEIFGYCDTSHLSREFRKIYGMPPRQFIKQLPPPEE
jgi:AraC-like DNA-binding protein